MESKDEEPSYDRRLPEVADAELHTRDEENASGAPLSEKSANGTTNGSHTTPSTPADSPEPKKEEEGEAPRSTLKIALIMASLCVSGQSRLLVVQELVDDI